MIVGSQKDDTDDAKCVNQEHNKKDPLLINFLILPPNIVEKSKKEKSGIRQRRIFSNMSNCDHHTTTNLIVTPYLDVHVTPIQQELLNSAVMDTITGFVIKDSQSEGEKKVSTETVKHD